MNNKNIMETNSEAGIKRILLVLACIFLLMNTSCKKKSPTEAQDPNFNAKITMTIEDVTCTEAWLNLHLIDATLPVNISLLRDTITIKNFVLSKTDTTLFIDSLLPAKNYTYMAKLAISNAKQVESAKLTVTTLDTSSHNFTWQTWLFAGQRGSSELTGVGIFDENNIWAVGDLYFSDAYTYDSIGNWIETQH